ncbi:MAG: hypothetical protein J6T82_00700 [Bacteroidaceae bacterium]|nr:hypothetical protein [Bacteroidaceae bacterium]
MKRKKVMGKQDKLNIDLNDNRNVYQNTAQDYIVITKDKLELILIKTEKCLSSKNAWMTPLGLVVSSVLAIISTDFKDFILPANVWYAFFVITTIICFIWLCYTLYLLSRNWNKGNIEDIINKIIAESGK